MFSRSIFLRLVATSFAIEVAQAAQTCYFKNSNSGNVQVGTNSFPCNNTGTDVLSCCNNGDICGEDSLCYHPDSTGKNDGYLIGGCTDPNFAAPQCSSHCSTYTFQNVAFDTNKGLWGCCGNQITHCTTIGTSEFFSAIPESSWSALPTTLTASGQTVSTASSTSTAASTTQSGSSLTTKPSQATASTTSTNTASPSSSSSSTKPSSGLSSGTAAGIGVGCTVAGIALLSTLIFLVRRRQRRGAVQGGNGGDYPSEMPDSQMQKTSELPSPHHEWLPQKDSANISQHDRAVPVHELEAGVQSGRDV